MQVRKIIENEFLPLWRNGTPVKIRIFEMSSVEQDEVRKSFFLLLHTNRIFRFFI